MILALGDWFDVAPIRSARFALPIEGDVIETRGGLVQVIENTSRQWEISLDLGLSNFDGARRAEALIDIAMVPGTVVEITPEPWRSPRLDPGGNGIVGSMPIVAAVSTDGRRISLSGLPPGYRLSAGDWLSVEIAGAGGGRILRLYRLQAAAAADESGALGPVAVSPRVDDVVQPGASARLKDPIALAVALPSSIQRGRLEPGRWSGGSLTLRQTLAEVQP